MYSFRLNLKDRAPTALTPDYPMELMQQANLLQLMKAVCLHHGKDNVSWSNLHHTSRDYQHESSIT